MSTFFLLIFFKDEAWHLSEYSLPIIDVQFIFISNNSGLPFLLIFLKICGKTVETFFRLFIFLFALMKDNYDITLAFKKAWQKKILDWYFVNKRDLPWRKKTNQNFYKIWISEIMLQQTTVTTVIPFYKRFLKKWPSLKSFFNATLEEILYEWQGLGYYQRAKNLFKAKEFLKSNKLIIDSKNLVNIPGIGEYTSCSISAILKDESCAVAGWLSVV